MDFLAVLRLVELVLVRLAALAVFAAAAWGWGCALLRLPAARDSERAALRGAAGLVALGSAAFALAAAGLLTPAAALLLLAAPWILPRAWRETAAALRAVAAAWSRPVAAGLGLGAVPVFLWAIYPPLGFDAGLYHLPMVRSLIEEHRFVFLETLRFPAFPAFDELLFALLAPLAGDAGANLVQFVQLAIGALALYAAGRRPTRLAGWLAAALWLGSPLVIWEASAGMVDLGVGVFAVCAFLAAEIWRRGGGWVAIVWAGAFAGAAAAIKYTGLLVLAAFFATLLFGRRGGAKDARFKSLVAAALGALLVAAPHYARIAVQTGSPIHPYVSAGSGEARWQPGDKVASSAAEVVARGRALLSLPYEALFARERWNRLPPPSPALILLTAASLGLLFRRRLERRWLAAAIGLLAAFVLLLPRATHYALPAAALACLPAAAVGEMLLRGRRRLACGLVVAIALPGPVYAAWWVTRLGPLPATPLARDAFLAARVPGYEALAWLNRRHGRDYGVYGAHLEAARHFAAGRFVGDWWGPWDYRHFALAARDGAGLAALLRAADTEYLLVAPGRQLPRDSAFAASFEELARYRDGTRLFRRRP